jgi:hypothetical protein
MSRKLVIWTVAGAALIAVVRYLTRPRLPVYNPPLSPLAYGPAVNDTLRDSAYGPLGDLPAIGQMEVRPPRLNAKKVEPK